MRRIAALEDREAARRRVCGTPSVDTVSSAFATVQDSEPPISRGRASSRSKTVDKSSFPLIARIRAGDRQAIGNLLERHVSALRGYVRLRCGPVLREQESCSDLVQSACREVLEDLGQFEYRGEAAFRRWLFQAAERKLMDRVRYYGRGKRDVGREASITPGSGAQEEELLTCYATFCTPSQHAVAREQVAKIEKAMDQLPVALRDVILLARFQGLSSKELGCELGCSPENARVRLSRALAKLATLLDSSQS